jgi:hypothetical protein
MYIGPLVSTTAFSACHSPILEGSTQPVLPTICQNPLENAPGSGIDANGTQGIDANGVSHTSLG